MQFLFPGATSVVLDAVKAYAPDITMRIQGDGNATRSADNVSNTFFHELAHSIHYAQVGNSYWVEEILYTLKPNKGGPYGTKTTPGAGRAAVVESWGFYVGPTFNDIKYRPVNITIANAERNFLESQRRDDTIPWRAFNGSTSAGWIPWGFLHDCTDVGEPTTTLINDQVSGYTMSALFKGYTSSATTVQTLRANILSTNGNAQSTQVNALVASYGW